MKIMINKKMHKQVSIDRYINVAQIETNHNYYKILFI